MKDKKVAALVEEVRDDLRKRQQARKCFETRWQMNMNFYMGHQFCTIGYGGEIEDIEKRFFWQQSEVFNHIAPIMDLRMAKLSKINPKLMVVPASNDENDINSAKISKKVIIATLDKLNFEEKAKEALKWSEICGTVFYKMTWNGDIGQAIAINETGSTIMSGDIELSVCSPFEIYPDSNTYEDVDMCRSIIHVKAYGRDQVKSMYGIEPKAENISIYGFDEASGLGGLGYAAFGTKLAESKLEDSVLVIERYERPSADWPNGRLTIVAGNELVFDGDLPYINGENGERTFPFIRQVAIKQAGSFWGESIVDRLIPVQRAYNAVKNRKHEFLNRMSMGVLKVEDGSVDIDNLEDEGLCPGKILVYRQGSNPPTFLMEEDIPKGFEEEEERLISEFKEISGVSEVLDGSYSSKTMNATALQLMIQEDEMRLSITMSGIKNCIKKVAKQLIRLYKQFASLPRMKKFVGDNGEVELFYFTHSNLSNEDIVFEVDTEAGESLSQRRDMIFQLLQAGILNDDDGKMSSRMKSKVLTNLGFGVWEHSQDLNELHINKAKKENLRIMLGKPVEVSTIDDDQLHIGEHIAFMLSGEYEKQKKKKPEMEDIFLKHIQQHKTKKSEE